MAQRVIDLTYGLDQHTPVFSGDPPLEITIVDSTARAPTAGARAMNSSHIALSLHVGTHLDAPFHFFADGRPIDRLPIEQCMGPTVLVNLTHRGAGAQITQEDLVSHRDSLRETQKVVLNTYWYRRWGNPEFFTDHPVITGEAAEFLVDCGVHLVGVDLPSLDHLPYDAHEVLLGNGVVIVENLTNLEEIATELFEFVVLPLKIVGGEASPVRAIAVVED